MASEASTTVKPEYMGDCLNNAIHVLNSAKGIPSALFRNSAGVLLVSAKEIGFVISNQYGAGVALVHNSDKSWSAPIAISLEGYGAGAVFGKADKDVLMILNPLAMDKLLQGTGPLKVGLDFGFAAGKTGGSFGGDLLGSAETGGALGTSFVYTFSKGALLSVQVETCLVNTLDEVNKSFYDTADPKKILSSDMQVPRGYQGDLVTELHAKLKASAKKAGSSNE